MVYIDEKQLRKEFDSAHNPVYLFDDDADGLCSFLQVYRHIKDGKGIIVKTTPRITEQFVGKCQDHTPDKIFVLDIATVDQEFIDKVKIPVVWVDHHGPVERNNIKYHNSRIQYDNNIPTSMLCYNALKKDLWIAMAGIVADWQLPRELAKEFSEKYPKLLPADIKKPEDAMFTTEIGRLGKILGFNLKGNIKEVMKSIKVLTRINDPFEILNGLTPQGKFILKKYEKIDRVYTEILDGASGSKPDGKFLIYKYFDNKMSVTKEVSNETLYRNPDKIVIIGRVKSDEVKMSIRSRDYNVRELLGKALQGVEGFGGGHEHACGAVVKEDDFEDFIENFKREVE
ncbi:DHH family phosphoesterase [Candidatus Woesearchaeota archaeon]|nr:DHH family phosphoesterase [Candidatus Woesearchaeota archaeon]